MQCYQCKQHCFISNYMGTSNTGRTNDPGALHVTTNVPAPLDRHLLFPLQDLPPTLACCHTRPLAQPCCHMRPLAPRRRQRCHTRPQALPCCHARPTATRRRPRQAPRLSLDELGRRLASSLYRRHRRPLLSPGRPLRHQACSLLARLPFTDRPQRSSTSTSSDSSPLLVLFLPCPREPCPFPPW